MVALGHGKNLIGKKMKTFSVDRNIGYETKKSYQDKIDSGFMSKYFNGDKILEIGHQGGETGRDTIVEWATGVDLDYPGYDGLHLPFEDESIDTIYSSHCFEHMQDLNSVLNEWYKKLKFGGYIVIVVPHQYLYEKKLSPPSRYNPYHFHFFTPGKLLQVVEAYLPMNGWRLRHLQDNDKDFDYFIPANQHSSGCYEIELVIQKIKRPEYTNHM